ncbi:RNA (uracil-5-)methyltransferase, putative [Plasmodium ovale wallikeri]|uniref:RNA (Uracil-5-)methyltransferase, putative n=1 Tax=Plasmodium ovale wallikeri TaxID=864142 RepID=A0A1A8YV81_PLAOA|nr:RNA (uracil-5-)methyltransferase, putative [Plasmodium ovale wallikeri]SBT36049.1 RNA (uracil-5-)methyltransferase, putative [Plasmodium ovale wallikeri]
MDTMKEGVIKMGNQNLVRNGNSNVFLSMDNYSNNLRDNRNTKLIKSNVLSIFSYTLKYMNKKSLNKWLKSNVKATFYDTFVPRNKPLAYIRFKNYDDLKIFEKIIENKRFYPNDSLSTIKINKLSKYAQKRKFMEGRRNGDSNVKKRDEVTEDGSGEESVVAESEDRDENNREDRNEDTEEGDYDGRKKNLHDRENARKKRKMDDALDWDENGWEKEEKILPDLQTIMKLNKKQKEKTIENYVTPFYKYPYSEQIKIKHKFLEKCKNQILTNLKNKFRKQSLVFCEVESGIVDEELSWGDSRVYGNVRSKMEKGKNGDDVEYGKSVEDVENNIPSSGKKNRKNETSKDSCLNKTVLNEIQLSGKSSREFSVEKKMKEYDLKLDNPLHPDVKYINGYRNKCEFTIAYDKNKNVEIGFVVGKVKTNVNEDNDENNCMFSENNISNSTSPINESNIAKLRNKKQKQIYFLNPIVKSVDDCLHIHACMKEVVNEMKSIIKDSNYPVFDRVYKTGVWRLLVVRCNSRKELMITVQTYSLDQKKKKEIKKLLINRLTKKKDEAFMSFSDFRVVSLYLQEHENSNDSSDQSENEHLWGVEFLEETLLSICAANEKKEEDIHVIGIDICEDSIFCANKNAEINNVKNYKFIKGRIEELFSSEIKNLHQNNCNIIVIVDPPRNGLTQSVLNILSSNFFINQIIYVSCNPMSLISNITTILFQNENFKMKNLVFVDMFPHTFHMECIANVIKSDMKL